jgi:hypothetical protein
MQSYNYRSVKAMAQHRYPSLDEGEPRRRRPSSWWSAAEVRRLDIGNRPIRARRRSKASPDSPRAA